MQVRFHGTRGSIAVPGPTTLRYGGNTACVEMRSAGGTLIVLDCGTGAFGLGQKLIAEALSRGAPLRGHLLITHTHWDHISAGCRDQGTIACQRGRSSIQVSKEKRSTREREAPV